MAVKIEVWGDYALFTRPEMKVERVSYDVMTPSAARGLLEAIYWHPGMRWIVDRIIVCSPIVFTNIRRNEVKSKISAHNVKQLMQNGKESQSIYTQKDIQQRASMLLKNVHYVIEAHFVMTDAATESDNPGKFQDIITRRIEKGQYYHQPYFGCREFPVNFKRCENIPPCPDELKGMKDLGFMLYDIDYSNSERMVPMFFRAVLNDGVLDIPLPDSEEVKK